MKPIYPAKRESSGIIFLGVLMVGLIGLCAVHFLDKSDELPIHESTFSTVNVKVPMSKEIEDSKDCDLDDRLIKN